MSPAEVSPRLCESISVIVPVYGCQPCLAELLARLDRTLRVLSPRFEIILVDDRSPDDAWRSIISLGATYSELRAIRLSRNFGQHVAITAGLAAARGDVAVVMDCDLQDPPELIAALHKKMTEGYDVVLGRRVSRTHSRFRVWSARAYFWILGQVAGEAFDGTYGCFSMLSRKVVDAFLLFTERERHYLFVLRWLGFKTGTIEYEHAQRVHGRSSYNLRRLVRHALDGLFFQTSAFLEWIVAVGLLFAVGGVTWALVLFVRYFFYDPPAGFTSLAVALLVSTGSILTSLGIVGLYIGKIFEHTKNRPIYVVDVTLGDEQPW